MIFPHLLNIIGITLMVISLITSTLLFFLSGLIIILLSFNLIIHTKGKSNDIFSPIFVFTIVLITACSVGAILRYLTSTYTEDILSKSLLYVIIFAISFVLGVSMRIGNLFSNFLPRLKPDFSEKRLKFITILFLSIGCALYFFLIWQAGFTSPVEIARNLLVFRQFWGHYGWAYIATFSLFLIQAPFWAWILKMDNPFKLNLFLGLYFILILTTSLLTGARSEVFAVVLGLFFIYHCKNVGTIRSKVPKMLCLIALLIIPASAFYFIQGTYRGGDVEIRQLTQIIHDFNFSTALLAFLGRFIDSFDGFVEILSHSHQLNFLWGASFYDALFMPIPRIIIPDKPYSFGMQMLKQIFPEKDTGFFGTDFSIVGELYMNFYLPGLIIGGFVFGIIIKMMQRYYITNQKNASFLFLYRPLILLPFTWFTNGLINSEANAILLLNLFFAFIFFKLVWPKRSMWKY